MTDWRYDGYNAGQPRAPSMTKKIWEYYYKCRVHAFQSRSVEDIRQNGMIMTGIKDLDDGLKNDWILVYKTIDQMVELFRRGCEIRLVVEEDTKDIYDTIQTHLTQWTEALRTGMNLGAAPLQDLIDMDKFANSVYRYAKYHFTPEVLQSVLGERMHEIQRINNFNILNNYRPGEGIIDKKKDKHELPERESLEERFKNSIMNMQTHRRF